MTPPCSPKATARLNSAGFTLTELLVAIGLGVSLLGTLAMLGQRATATTSARAAVDQAQLKVEAALGRAARELADAGAATLDPVPEPPFWTDALDFQCPAGFDATGALWSGPRRLELVADPADPVNGVDDDGDGVIDERILRLTVDDPGRTVVLASQVRALGEGEVENGEDDDGDGLIDERGFCVTVDGTTLRIELTLERADAQGGTVIASGVTRTWLGN